MARWRGLVIAAALSMPAVTAGQGVVVSGRVTLVTARGERPVAGTTVTLHRIGTGSAGPVDSLASSPAGRYRFVVPAPDTTAMYLATARFGGIAYFGTPVRAGDAAADGEIDVYDTTSVAIRVRVAGRHVVVSAPDARGRRDVLDVYELQNDTVLTRLASRERPVFEVRLPAGAADVMARQGDFTGAAIEIEGNRARVIAPMTPGIRQLALAYALAPGAFPLTLTLPDTTDVLEVLLEEREALAAADSLRAVGQVTSDGRSFVRFLGRGLPAGRRLEITVPVTALRSRGWAWLAGLGVASLVAIGWSLRPQQRRAAAVAPAASQPAARERELRSAIDGVDALLADAATAPESHDALRRYREQLAGELEALLARGAGPD